MVHRGSWLRLYPKFDGRKPLTHILGLGKPALLLRDVPKGPARICQREAVRRPSGELPSTPTGTSEQRHDVGQQLEQVLDPIDVLCRTCFFFYLLRLLSSVPSSGFKPDASYPKFFTLGPELYPLSQLCEVWS